MTVVVEGAMAVPVRDDIHRARTARRREGGLGAPRAGEAIDDAQAWSAVLGRDGAWDGRFVYAVATTGIYCRPSCAARRPKREHVTFFGSPEAAEEAGYRACRRCRPKSTLPPRIVRQVERARAFIDEETARATGERITLARITAAAGVSPYHLHRMFKRVMGLTPAEYVRARRRERLKAELRNGETVSRATYGAGYGSSSRVYDERGTRLGMTPGTYRHGGRGAHIRYTIVPTPFGRLLVGATERGVCTVTLGDSDAELVAGLAKEYPQATRERASRELDEWVTAIVRHLEGASPRLAIPVDLQATAFQRRVWRALQAIPYGETRSYSEIAAAIGAPRAARAVARACATNPVAIVVPCHRVVRGDGQLGGYRWGAERKRRLLERERERAT